VTLSQNYFQLFGLLECYNIDLAQLSENYRNIQRSTHPDRFASASKQEQLLSARYAADINEAYQTLRTPVKRAAYLLTLKGIEWDAEQSRLMDPEFLMQQISLREELEEVKKDSTDPESALDQMNVTLELLMDKLARQFVVQMKSLDAKVELEAIQTVNKMHFIAKIQYEVERLEAELLDY